MSDDGKEGKEVVVDDGKQAEEKCGDGKTGARTGDEGTAGDILPAGGSRIFCSRVYYAFGSLITYYNMGAFSMPSSPSRHVV